MSVRNGLTTMKTMGFGFESILYVMDGVARRFHDLKRRHKPGEAASTGGLSRVRCREIMPFDLDRVTDLLTFGFQRDRTYWVNAIKRLTEHPTPAGFPKYGYLLESSGVPVGVLLGIFTSRVQDGATSVRCNGSSLYMAPGFTAYASLLVRRLERFKDVTYVNLTPTPRTWTMMEAQGYARFSTGLYVALPRLGSDSANVKIQIISESCADDRLLSFEPDLLVDHAGFGCISLICESEGKPYPFVFGLYKKYGIPLAHLVYCRDRQDFVSLNRPVGQFLMQHGYPLVVLDSNDKIAGLLGRYLAIRPKYWRGIKPPRLGDLAYTERVMFGF